MPAFLSSAPVRFIRQEPLIHFLVAACLLLAAQHFLLRPQIAISPQMVNGLRKDYEARLGRTATEEEVSKLVDGYLEDEILFREAQRSGLMNDNRVRGLLVQTMRSAMRPAIDPPTDKDLEALRAETPDIYRLPAQVSFEHVSFEKEESIPPGLLDQLRGGTAATGLGDLARMANPLPLTFQPQLERMLGREFVQTLLGAEKGTWSGPFKSLRGFHFVRVIERKEPQDMPMEQVRSTLASQWNTVRENAAISEKARELRSAYRISLPPGFSARP